MTAKKINSKPTSQGAVKMYDPETLIKMFRLAAQLRNKMSKAGFSDNGGAIHSCERILNILGLVLNYGDVSHLNNVKHSKWARFSVDALKIHQRGGKVNIEHVSPHRHLTRSAIDEIDRGVSDKEFTRYIKKHYQLVLLSPEETIRLNQINRSTMEVHRLRNAGIKLVALKVKL